MKLATLEKIFEDISDCKQLYDEFIVGEKRGFKGKLPELRKKLGEIKDLITKAKKETMPKF